MSATDRNRTPKRLTWRAALGWSLAAVYVPGSMGLFADCSHCRGVWLKLWPVAPGMMPVEFIRGAWGWPAWGEASRLVAAGVVTALFILIVAAIGRRSAPWMRGAAGVAFVLSALAAFALSAAVRA